MNESKSPTNPEYIAGLAVASQDARQVDLKDKFVIVPEGYKLESLEPYQHRPERKKGNRIFTDVDDFVRYAKIHLTHQTQVYFNKHIGPSAVKIVFDDHDEEEPAWRDFSATLKVDSSTDWIKILANNDRMLSQESFAEFIEEHETLFVDPTSGEMADIANTISAKKAVHFRSSKRLANGDHSIMWDESTDTKAGASGELEIPKMIKLGVQITNSLSVRVEVCARLRTVVANGGVNFKYILVKPEKIEELVMERVRGKIEKDLGLQGYFVCS